jgi:pimeloyl-ACP methyl ester carboxylesterase
MVESAAVYPEHSTNVRLSWVGLLASASPDWAERWAEHTFCRTPKPQEPSAKAREVLAAGSRFEVPYRSGTIAAWRWGSGPAVLLLHGWGGRSSQLTSFAAPLVAAGASAIALDAPGHGASAGSSSSLIAFAEALVTVARVSGPVLGALGHSLGAAAVAFAAGQRGLDVPRLALVSSPANPERYFLAHLGALGVPAARRGALSRRLARRLGVAWPDFFVPALVRKFARPTLVVHDRADRETPWSDSEAIAAASPRAELVTTEGLGHRRILRDAEVVARAVSFFTGGDR